MGFGFLEMKCHGQIKWVKDISKTRNQSFEFLIPVTGHSFEILDIFAKRFFPSTDRSNYIFYSQNLTNFVFFDKPIHKSIKFLFLKGLVGVYVATILLGTLFNFLLTVYASRCDLESTLF